MELTHTLNTKRTDSSNEDFRKLIDLLDKELRENYQEEFDFYTQYNKVDKIKNVIVVCHNDDPIGCGAIKKYDSTTMEVKRMYTLPDYRGKGVASNVLNELELWTTELQYENCILETGTEQHAAMAMYQKRGYKIITNYGQYKGVPTSICFLKTLSNSK